MIWIMTGLGKKIKSRYLYGVKFLITENRLERVISKYLDNKNYIIKETDDRYYFLENEDDEYAQIVVIKDNSECFLYYELSKEIESFFSLEKFMGKGKEVLTRYVENTLNIEVSHTFIETMYSLRLIVH